MQWLNEMKILIPNKNIIKETKNFNFCYDFFADMDPSPPPASVSSPSHLHHDDGRVRMSPNNENGQDLTSRSDVSKLLSIGFSPAKITLKFT
jgi:hypothetical protein